MSTGEALPRSSESAFAMASLDYFGAPTRTGNKELIELYSWGKSRGKRIVEKGLEVLNHKCTY